MQGVSPFLSPRGNARGEFHRALAAFNHRRLTPTPGSESWKDELREEHEWQIREGTFVEEERALVGRRAATAPRTGEAFVQWFERLETTGPGQHDALFDWLALDAPRDAMVWFLTQEMAGEAGFEDLVALSQVKIPPRAKLELARNYWDEMGQGHRAGMHGPMLDDLANELGIRRDVEVVWESLALGNLMTALAKSRRYAFHAIGALGAIELTAPDRAKKVNAGLKRLGIGGAARRYFALHATLDIKHSEAWNREVFVPLVDERPELAPALAEGALMRLEAGRRCFERYRLELADDMGPPSRRAHGYLRTVEQGA